jgi:uncharacterized membrane protein HdeD (DUF308 family)
MTRVDTCPRGLRIRSACGPTTNKPDAGEMGKMLINVTSQAIISILAGVLILMVPRLLNYIVAVYLILSGVFSMIR